MKTLGDVISEFVLLIVVSMCIVCAVHLFMEDYMFSVGITNPDYSQAQPKAIAETICVFGTLFLYNQLVEIRNRRRK